MLVVLFLNVIGAVLYVAIALVITGMVSYTELNVGDPLAYVFEKIQSLKNDRFKVMQKDEVVKK